MAYLIIVKIILVILSIMLFLIPFNEKIAGVMSKLYLGKATILGDLCGMFSKRNEISDSQGYKVLGVLFIWVVGSVMNLFIAFLWPPALIIILLYKVL